MRKPQRANSNPAGNGADEANGSLIGDGARFSSRKFCVLAGGVLLGLASLTACSEGRRENSELRAEPPTGPAAPAAAAAGPGPANAAEPAEAPAAHAGPRYRVAVETAYFFTQPKQSIPSGRYLRRGDTFYGQTETNGFVQAVFTQPDGTTGSGWLKIQGLRRLAAGPGGSAATRSRRLPPTTRPPAAPAPASEYDYETDEAALPPSPAGRAEGRAVVVAARAYFYPSADLALPRKAHCVPGDKVRLGETRGDAVYVTFTNWEKVVTRGWMRRADLRPVQ